MYEGVLLSTLSVAHVARKPIVAYILTADIKTRRKSFKAFQNEQAERIENILKKYNPCNRVVVKDVKTLFDSLFGKSVNVSSGYTPYAFMRLLLDKMDDMPSMLLYMDTDTIAMKDVDSIFDIDMADYDIGLVQDAVGKHYFGKRYGNSGILLINLDNVKKHGTFEKARWRVNHIRMFMPDQTALNIVCGRAKTKLMLPLEYNEQLDTHENTIIRHYCKRMYWLPVVHNVNIKPWDIERFRKRFGEDAHKELIDEFISIREKEHKEGIVLGIKEK